MLAVYNQKNSDSVQWAEQHLYGSSRLGMWLWAKPVPTSAPNVTDTPIEDAYHSGSRSYELSNHLGNVLATISDKKVGVAAQPSDTLVSHFVADVTSTQDYYPFGMLMPGRRGAQVGGGWAEGGSSGSGVPQSLTLESRDASVGEYKASLEITFEPGFGSESGDAFLAEITQGSSTGGSGGFSTAAGGYRYGFNGKENDSEIKGEGSQQDYGMRIYDPRLGKFLSVDPLSQTYPELSSYQFASNTPIQAIDLDGLEAKYVFGGNAQLSHRSKLEKSEWLVINQKVDWASFAAASQYNTSTGNTNAYKSIWDRHNWYKWAASRSASRGNFWFSAAADVTSTSMVGAAEDVNLWLMDDDMEDLLQGANKFLFEQNFKNFGQYALEKGPVS